MKNTFIRFCEQTTQLSATEPIKIDIDKLRQCDPPYTGKTDQDLLNYLEEIYADWDWAETNQDIIENAETLIGMNLDFEQYYNSGNDDFDGWIETGKPAPLNTRHGAWKPTKVGNRL